MKTNTNTLTLTATTSGDDIYQFTGSFGIAHAAAESKATKIERLGSGEAQPGNVNSRSTFFRVSGGQAAEGVLCCTTNGDPLWQEEDPETFAAHAEACGVELTASSPYDGLDIDEASQYAAQHSALPPVGVEIAYADELTSDAAYHNFVRRLRDRGLDLHDHGNGYMVRRGAAE